MAQTELTLGVDGMACDGCAKAVMRAINQLDPAARVSVDLPAKRVRIVEATRDRAKYEAAISAAGYDVLTLPSG